MATNAKNIAELLNTDTTVKVGDIEDGSVTTAKLADSAVTTAKVDDNAITSAKALNLGRRNLIFNGGMQVAQRSTSTTNVSSAGYHACDRWNIAISGRDEAGFTISQNTSSIVDGFTNSFKVQTTTAESAIASSEYFIVRQKIEAQNLQHLAYATSSAKSTTLSFYVKSSIAATFAVYVYKPDSTGRIIGGTYTINSANTWEYKTITFAGDTDSGATINDDNGEGLHISFVLAVGSDYTTTNNTSWADYASGKLAFGHAGNAVVTTTNATWEITGVQFEVGSASTDFEHRSFGEELSICRRYYQINYTSWYGVAAAAGYYVSDTISYVPPMRANPAVAQTSFVSGSGGRFTSGNTGATSSTIQGTTIYSNPASSGGNSGYNATFSADAEL